MAFNISITRKTKKIASCLLITCAFFAGTAHAAPAPRNQSPQSKFTVVIDAGHGGHDTGAIDNGVKEKDINLGVAKKLTALIQKKMKDSKVVMTREGDTFISLQERANIANRNHGNLFVSIHTNSLDKNNPKRKTTSGTSVYALGLHKDADNQKVARRENSVIELESNYEQKYSGFDPAKDESYIIFEMAQKKNLGQSLKFANAAQKELASTAKRQDRGVKQAGFWVLWATSMPSVLVELDFICNPTSAKYLGSEKGQQELAQALFNAIEDYAKHVSTTRSQTNVKNKQVKEEKQNKKKKDKKKRKSLADEPVKPQITEPVSEDDNVPVLASSTSASNSDRKKSSPVSQKNTRSVNYADVRNRTSKAGARKRRSSSSKLASDSRDIDSKKILLKEESDYLAKVEARPVVTISDERQVTADNDKNKNKKNKKNKNTKEKKSGKSDKNKSNKSPKEKEGLLTKDNKGKVAASSTIKKHKSLAGKNNVRTISAD